MSAMRAQRLCARTPGPTSGPSLVEHELLGVDQRPEDVLVGGLLVGLVPFDVRQGLLQCPPPACGRGPGNSSSTFSASGRGSLASRSARPPARATACPAPPRELSRCSAWARLASLTRSHSQALMRCGRPNTSRKYDWNDSSGSMIARFGACLSCRQAGERRPGCWSPGRPRRTAPRRVMRRG